MRRGRVAWLPFRALSGLAALAMLLAVAACAPPLPELKRPVSAPDSKPAELLPPGRIGAMEFPRALDGAAVATDNGGRMAAFRFATPELALTGLSEIERRVAARAEITSRNTVRAGQASYIRYSGSAVSGLAWVSATWLFSAEASDAAGLAAMIATSRAGGLAQGIEQRIVSLLPWLVALGIAIAIPLTIVLMKLLLRRLTVPPVAGAAAVARDELERRLMAINDPAVPFVVRRGPEADIVVEWKFADASWWGVLAKSGMRKAYRLRLYLDDEVRCVYALDEFGEVDWSAGVLATPRVHFKATFFRGVVLSRRERGTAYGFRTPTGGAPGKVLDYKFDIETVKRPVIELVTTSGWTYQPILWPRRTGKAASKTA